MSIPAYRRMINHLPVMMMALVLTACHTPPPDAAHKAPAPTPQPPSAAAPQSLSSQPAAVPSKTDQPAADLTALFPPGKEIALFDGKTLTGWRVPEFGGSGPTHVEQAFHGTLPAIVLDQGVMTGITWTNPLPRQNYEITLEAMRVLGSDFFCGLTFPVGKDPCSFIAGGWGGGVVGLSSVDSEDAAHNETTKFMKFENERWYRIRLKVTPEAIQAWIDDESMVNLKLEDRTLSIRLEVEASKPLGFATWSTTGALRNLRLRSLSTP